MKRVVMFSGGIGSWAAARRVVERFGPDDMTLLFADTMSEAPDLYRFLADAAADIGVPVTRIADGRNIWQLFRDKRFLGNSHAAPCTSELKRKVLDGWAKDNCDPTNTVFYVGLDWTEEHRFVGTASGSRPGLRAAKAAMGWTYEAPMCEPPPVAKWQMKKLAVDRGLRLSESYDMGLGHDNCGGGCVKAGVGHWVTLWRVRPAWYLQCEREEHDLRVYLGKDVTILAETVKGVDRGLTLRDLRRRIECGEQFDMFAVGGCGCSTEDEVAA